MPYTVGRSGTYEFDQVMICPADTTLLAGESAGLAWNAIDTQFYYPSWDVVANRTPSRVQVRTGGLDTFKDPQTFFQNTGTSPKYVTVQGGIGWAPHNLNTHSQDPASATLTHLTATDNTTTAPDGTVTGATFAEDSTTNFHFADFAAITIAAGQIVTVSFYGKDNTAGTNRHMRIQGITLNNQTTANFDIVNGIVTSTGTLNAGTILSTNIVSVGSGWWRCSLSGTYGTDTSINLRLSLTDSGDNGSYLGTGLSTFVWGMQVNLGIVPTRYIATTSAAVIGIPVAYGQGLVSEGAATNLLIQSQNFTLGSPWIDKAGVGAGSTILSVSTNVATAPDGTNTADKVIGVNGDVNFKSIDQGITKAASAITYTFSVYLKISDASITCVQLNVGFSTGFGTAAFGGDFNLSTGTAIGSPYAYGSGWSVTSSNIVYVGNGWFRVSVTGTTDAVTTSIWCGIAPADTSDSTTWTGNGSKGMYVWGAQLETGTFASSYIPTVAATVTRSGDVPSTVSLSSVPFSTSTESLFYWAAQRGLPVNDGLDINDANNNFDIYFKGSTNEIHLFVASAGVTQLDASIANYTNDVFYKIATRYQAANFRGAVNGTLGPLSASGVMPVSANSLGIGINNVSVRQLMIVSRAYSDAELQAKTT